MHCKAKDIPVLILLEQISRNPTFKVLFQCVNVVTVNDVTIVIVTSLKNMTFSVSCRLHERYNLLKIGFIYRDCTQFYNASFTGSLSIIVYILFLPKGSNNIDLHSNNIDQHSNNIDQHSNNIDQHSDKGFVGILLKYVDLLLVIMRHDNCDTVLLF